MGVEAAVRQADLLHDVGDARAVVPASPNGPRGGPDDPFVGDLLAAWGGPPGGGSAHMMVIIYQSGAERKGACSKTRPAECAMFLCKNPNGRGANPRVRRASPSWRARDGASPRSTTTGAALGSSPLA